MQTSINSERLKFNNKSYINNSFFDIIIPTYNNKPYKPRISLKNSE